MASAASGSRTSDDGTSADARVFIVTAELDDESFAWLNELRRRHFPAERNYLDAHLTLFHKLDEEGIAVVKRVTEAWWGPIALSFAGLRKLGRGVAVEVAAPGLVALRSACAANLAGRLTPQDSQRLRPHVTIQNKVDPKIANALFAALSSDFVIRQGETHALRVWEYLGGPWRLVARFAFA